MATGTCEVATVNWIRRGNLQSRQQPRTFLVEVSEGREGRALACADLTTFRLEAGSAMIWEW